MLKKIFYPVLLCSFISAPVLADLQKDMQVLANSVDVIESDSNVDSIRNALENMKAAAISAKNEIPDSLLMKNSDSPEVNDYREGYDLLIGKVEKAQNLLSEGDLSGAKAIASEIKEIRNTWHEKYR
ncbi:cytochrome b562 [Salmonella enterica]|uniref:cytochrome b562 n=1 Tax=Salmonella enterica TaxID=28901 RepID=UPI00073B540B|nr:cytochrome b562 [Salmonella enterica]EAM9745100.1 cytochrome b562 [Salmonella enterica]EAO2482283.1 cytochrome b562 [Salmonella enterica]EAR4894908.1 cytochrome b562 [Salmonella enterica]EAR9246518.1 cytochrome b562 [Salmonella enterica]EAS3200813.1 cytochrome b562 [Salmonella enterica]